MSDEPAWGPDFLIDGRIDGPLRLEQVNGREFELRSHIEFTGDMGLDHPSFRDITDEMRADARTLDASVGRSDLASVPRFLRWFADPYGVYTPAALIHDDLIVGGAPNAGTLGNDAAADRYFRFMLASSGVAYFRRWIMWAAVALRTRWAVGGHRRVLLLLWVVVALLGNAAAFALLADVVFGTGLPDVVGRGGLALFAATAPVVAGLLWGRQWGASIVAALAAPWILPPTVLAVVGYVIYAVIERLGRVASLR